MPGKDRDASVMISRCLSLGRGPALMGGLLLPARPRCPSCDIPASGLFPCPQLSPSLSLLHIPLGADQGLNDTPDDSLLLIPTHRMGPLFSSPRGIAVAKAIPRVPDLTLLLAAPLHVPTPRARGPAAGKVQRGSLPAQGSCNNVPRMGQQDHPASPEA